jgi:NADPH-dependent 2,4-dienoyl-CoA reductase/sulfur reductase-like enzyme
VVAAHQEVVTAGGRHYPYWHLVLACGANPVPLHVPGVEAGDRVAKILSDNGVRFLGSTTVTDIDNTHVHLDTGAMLEGDVVVSATGVRPDPHLAEAAGLDTQDGRIVVDEHMHTSVLNVDAAGDVALGYNVTAGRRIPAEHWRDAAQQGLVAGLSAAGHEAAMIVVLTTKPQNASATPPAAVRPDPCADEKSCGRASPLHHVKCSSAYMLAPIRLVTPILA